MQAVPFWWKLAVTYGAMASGAWMLHRAYATQLDLASWLLVAIFVGFLWVSPWLYFGKAYPHAAFLFGAGAFALVALAFAWLTLGPPAGPYAPSGFRDHVALAILLLLPSALAAWCFRRAVVRAKPAEPAVVPSPHAPRPSGWHRHRKRGRAH